MAAYVFFLVFPLLLSFHLSFNNVLYKAVRKQGVTNSVNLSFFYRKWDIPLLFDSM